MAGCIQPVAMLEMATVDGLQRFERQFIGRVRSQRIAERLQAPRRARIARHIPAQPVAVFTTEQLGTHRTRIAAALRAGAPPHRQAACQVELDAQVVILDHRRRGQCGLRRCQQPQAGPQAPPH